MKQDQFARVFNKMSKYLHGHHESVLRSHSWRTAQNSAAFLLPHLKDGSLILDVGCGPATITIDLAKNYVPNGKVIGLETNDDIISQAKTNSEKAETENIEFVKGSVFELPFPDNHFDVIYAHQVLQHLQDPVGALIAMEKKVKPGGIIAVRDADYAGMIWYPESNYLDDWQTMYRASAKSLKAEPDAGRRLCHWAHEAGFDKSGVTASSSNWTYNTKDEISWWSGLWADRVLHSTLAVTAKQTGEYDDEKLKKISKAWREWGETEDAWFCVLNGELLYQKPL